MSDIDDAVRHLNLGREVEAKALIAGYRTTAKENKQLFTDFMKANRDGLKQTIQEAKDQLIPLKQQRWDFIRGYAGREKLGTGERIFNRLPEFRGKFFDDKVATLLEQHYGDMGSKISRSLGSVGAMSRNLTLALDNSVLFIQGQALLGRNPLLWGKTFLRQIEFIIRPDNFAKYMADPVRQVLHNEMRNAGITIAPFEIVEASKLLEKGISKVPFAKQVYKQTYGRGEVMFTSYGQIAKDNLWTALKKPNMTESELFELGRSLDRMTGVMSTQALGISRTQRDIESAWLFLTPRYTRASLSYIADIFKGGISGAESRKSLGMLMAGGMTIYVGVSKALGQQPNLDPTSSRFMTIKVGDSHMGIGGSMYTLMRLGANVAATMVNPETRGELSPLNLSRVDNPFYKYLYSKTSPLTTGIVSIMEQKDYFGEPFENIGDWGKFLAEKVTPLAIQQTWEKGGASPAVLVSGLLGARTFPKSDWELQEEAKDRVAIRETGRTYEQLDMLDRRRVDNAPEVTQFQEAIDKQTTVRGQALSVAFLERSRELDDARFMHKSAIEDLQLAYDNGDMTGYDFRLGVLNANTGYGATYEHINSNPRFAEVLKKLQQPKDISKSLKWELAYDELMTVSSSNKFDDKYGSFKFDEYNTFLDELKLKYGEANFNRAMEMKNEKYAEYPPLFQEYQRAKEVMKPYWAVEDRVVKLFGQGFADTPRGKSLISKLHKQKRLTDPEIERYYQMFYAQS